MDSPLPVRVTYYLEVISSWCWWSEPGWAALQREYQGRVEFGWKLALLGDAGFPGSVSQMEWFYRRSGTLMQALEPLNAGWFEPHIREYLAPNLVAEAARDFGVNDDRVRLAIARAALKEGRPVGRWEVAAEIGGQAAAVEPDALLRHARSAQVEGRVRASTAEFQSFQIDQRPAYLIEDQIGDRAIFSGLAKPEPLSATIEAMLADTRGYASFRVHFGGPPEA